MVDDIIATILSYINREKLTAGQKLPPERILAAELGLNRTSLREGLAVMEYMRCIERKHGSGAYLLDLRQSSFEGGILFLLQQDGITLDDANQVYEAVVTIESVLSKLAAEKSNPEDIDFLDSLNNQMEQLIAQGKNTYLLDAEFHRKIALLSKNTFLMQISAAFWLKLAGYAQVVQENPEPARDLLQHHRLIVEAMRKGDGGRTELLMKQHYHYSMDFIQKNRLR